MRRSLLWLAVLTASCGGDTVTAVEPPPPPSPFVVSFSGVTSATGRFTTVDGATVYACTFSFTASATGGTASDYALWTLSSIQTRLTSNGQTGQLTVYSTDLQDWFGADRIRSGQSLTAGRVVQWTGPYTGLVLFRYSAVTSAAIFGEDRTTTVPIACN